MAVASGRRRTRRRRSEPTTRASKVMTLTSRRVPLATLAPAVQGQVRGDAGTLVTDIALDTRRVVPGALFCCVPGARVDGHDLAGKALDAGAAALCVQRPLDLEAPQLVVPNVRDALAPLAATFFDHPSGRFDLVGVTGTNGKTTTTYMLEAIFRAAGRLPGVLGTVEVRVGDERRPAVHTTPEAPDLQRLLAEMADAGVGAAAMEVSSHGLALRRVDGTRFTAAIFTNLTQDHLDFHTDLDDYYLAKRRLFTAPFTPLGVVNVDDPHGRRLAGTAEVATVTTGTADDADTPDSLDNLLRAARAVTGGRVIVVFGCGGDRDRAKRPLMGEIAGRLADVAVVTSDNPRSEDPGAIVAQVAEGVARATGPDGFLVEVDRRAAIRAALAMAGPGDAVLLAGKGHEQGQEFAGGRKVPFDDRLVAAEELA